MTDWAFLSLWALACVASGWVACRVHLHFSGRYPYGGPVKPGKGME